MAKGTGNYGAYVGAQPIKEDYGDNLIEHEQAGFRHRAEKRQVDQIKLEADEKLRDRAVKARKGLQPVPTGIKSEDEKRGKLALLGAENLNAAIIKLEKDPNDIEASLLMSNYEDFPARFKQMTERYGEWMNGGLTGLDDGTYSKHLNQAHFDNVNKVIDGQVEYGFDEKGNITGSYDRDGDGTPDFSWHGMATGVDLPEFKQRFNLDNFKSKLKEQHGTEHIKSPDGTYTTRELKGVSKESKESIRIKIGETIGTTVDSLTDNGKSYIYDELDLNPSDELTDEMVTQVNNKLYLESLAMWDKTDIKTKNYADENSDLNRALSYAKIRAAKEKEAVKAKKPNPKQEEANLLRRMVDGSVQGDSQEFGRWSGRTLYKKGSQEIKVVETDHTGKELVLLLSDGTKKRFDVSTPEAIKKSTGELTSLADIKKPADQQSQMYEMGEAGELSPIDVERDKSIFEINDEYNKASTNKGVFNTSGKEIADWVNKYGFVADNDGWGSKTIIVQTDEGRKTFDTTNAGERRDLLNMMKKKIERSKSGNKNVAQVEKAAAPQVDLSKLPPPAPKK